MSPQGRSSFAFQIAFFKLCRFYSLPKQEKEVSLKSSLVFYDESCLPCLHDSPSMTQAGRATLEHVTTWKSEPYRSFILGDANSLQTLPKPRTSFITSISILFWFFVKKDPSKQNEEVKKTKLPRHRINDEQNF